MHDCTTRRFQYARSVSFVVSSGDTFSTMKRAMYSVASTRKCPLPIEGSSTLTARVGSDFFFLIRSAFHRCLQHRPHRLFDDIFDNVVGRVVAARGFALSLVVEQVDGPTVLCFPFCFLQVIFQQTLVDRPQIAYGEVTVVDKLPIDTSE